MLTKLEIDVMFFFKKKGCGTAPNQMSCQFTLCFSILEGAVGSLAAYNTIAPYMPWAVVGKNILPLSQNKYNFMI